MASHTVLARRLGWTDEQIQNLNGFEQRADFTSQEKVALRLAERVTQNARQVDDELWKAFREHFDEGQVVELLCAIWLFNYFNLLTHPLALHPTHQRPLPPPSPS